jgi:hypothetical protein
MVALTLCSIPMDMKHLRPQLYQQDQDFATTYHLLGTGATVTDFYIQERILCPVVHLYVPTRERAKMIWVAHYSRMA